MKEECFLTLAVDGRKHCELSMQEQLPPPADPRMGRLDPVLPMLLILLLLLLDPGLKLTLLLDTSFAGRTEG